MIRTVHHFITNIPSPALFKILLIPQISLFGQDDTQGSNTYKAAIEIQFKLDVHVTVHRVKFLIIKPILRRNCLLQRVIEGNIQGG
jgi:hypothetical protein